MLDTRVICRGRSGPFPWLVGIRRLGDVNGPIKPLSDDEVIALVLDGLANDGDLDEIREALYLAHDPRTGFPGRLLLKLASSAFRTVGATTADTLELDDIDGRFLADWPARRSAGHRKRRYALTAAVLLAAKFEPEGTGWWRVDDLWFHAFHAVIVYVRAGRSARRLRRRDLHRDPPSALGMIDTHRGNPPPRPRPPCRVLATLATR